jgi:FkbM family methyltransferase
VLSIECHGVTLRFDDEGIAETPYVYRPIVDGRVYEQPFLEAIRDLDRRGVYVDVGGHLGTHALWFATLCPSQHVHTFEPVDRFAERIESAARLTECVDKITVHRVGLSERSGTATNRLSAEHQMGFNPDAQAVDETFPVARLDDVIRGPVAVMKLDVEGMEPAVLQGARRVLRRHRPVVYAEAWDGDAVERILRELRPYGYRKTERVWGANHEFVAPPRRGLEWFRPLDQRLPSWVRRRVSRLRRSLRTEGP